MIWLQLYFQVIIQYELIEPRSFGAAKMQEWGSPQINRLSFRRGLSEGGIIGEQQ